MPYLIFPPIFLNPAYSILPESASESFRMIMLGTVLAAYPLGQFIGSPILGALSDDYGRKKILSGSLVISAFCYLFTAIAIGYQHLGLLVLSRLLAGLMEGNIAIARAMAADLKTISKHESFGKINATISIGYLVGPLIGGLLTDNNLFAKLTTSTPFYSTAVLFFALAAISVTLLQKGDIIKQVKNNTLWQRLNLFGRIHELFKNKRLKHVLIASTIFTLAVDIFFQFGPILLTLKWTLGPAQLIFYNIALCIGLVIGDAWLPAFLAKRLSPLWSICLSLAGFALILLGIVLTNSNGAMIALFGLSGLAIGLGVTVFSVKISNAAPDSIQGEVMGTQISLRVLGDGFICFFGGALLILSSKIILLLAVALSISAMIYYNRTVS
jgi:MFS family permease